MREGDREVKVGLVTEVVCGGGGGRGKYAGIEGDVPVANKWRRAEGIIENQDDGDARGRRRFVSTHDPCTLRCGIEHAERRSRRNNMVVTIILKNTRSLAGDVRGGNSLRTGDRLNGGTRWAILGYGVHP